MQEMTTAYENTIEAHQRQVILLNLLRASADLPMSFTTIPTWTGSAGINAGGGVTGQLYGQLMSNAGLSTSVTVSRNFNFTLSSLDNAEFMKGFLSDTPLERFHVFSSSADRAPDLFYTLLVAGISLNPNTARAQVYPNQADSRNFQAFQTVLQQLLAAGLKTEPRYELRAVGPALSKDEAIQILKSNVSTMKGQFQLVESSKAGITGYQTMVAEGAYRFCLGSASAQLDYAVGRSIACAANTNAEALPTAAGHEPLDAISIDIRSTRDVFKYLGRAVRKDLDNAESAPPAGLNRVASKPLLHIVKGQPAPGVQTIASVNYLNMPYFIPLDESSHAAAVFDILASLLAMNKISGAIPASPGILVR
jgi:hypothetical protein